MNFGSFALLIHRLRLIGMKAKSNWKQLAVLPTRVLNGVANCSSSVNVLDCSASRYSAHQRAGKRLTNLSVVLSDGPLEDFVRTSSSEQMLQDHVLELFRRYKFSGFEVKPVAARFEDSPERRRHSGNWY